MTFHVVHIDKYPIHTFLMQVAVRLVASMGDEHI